MGDELGGFDLDEGYTREELAELNKGNYIRDVPRFAKVVLS